MKARRFTAAVVLVSCAAGATAVHASEGKFNTPLAGKTKAQGAIGSNYDARKRKLRNLSLDWGCSNVNGGAPTFTSSTKLGKVYATVSSLTKKFHASISTTYGTGTNGVIQGAPLGQATITMDGKIRAHPGKVNGSGTVSVDTTQCSSGRLTFTWNGKNGTRRRHG
jgi:hypothetical protein